MFAIARKNDPAANMNAQSVVIHSLHRPGAPGIDAAPSGGRRRADQPEATHPDDLDPRFMLRRVENDW